MLGASNVWILGLHEMVWNLYSCSLCWYEIV